MSGNTNNKGGVLGAVGGESFADRRRVGGSFPTVPVSPLLPCGWFRVPCLGAVLGELRASLPIDLCSSSAFLDHDLHMVLNNVYLTSIARF